MKPKFRQGAGHFDRLLVRKLNPNPFANYFRQFEETRCTVTKNRQQTFGVERTIHAPMREIDSGQTSLGCVQLFGSALEL